MTASFGGQSSMSSWQSVCGFIPKGPAKSEGARLTPPTEWIPTEAPVPSLQGLQELPGLQDANTAIDDDEHSISTIGSLEEEVFAGDE
jgi:hypothetical protein